MKTATIIDLLVMPSEKGQQLEIISVELLDNLACYPYPLILDTDMADLIQSISEHGIEEAIKVRTLPDSRYGIVCGHRRIYEVLKLKTIPAIIEVMDKEYRILFGAFTLNIISQLISFAKLY